MLHKKKGLFEKGFTPNWTEVITISKVQRTDPITDHTFGLKDKDGQFLLGDAEVGIDGNDLISCNKRYHGTPGLWDLIVMKKQADGFATEEDKDKYLDVIDKTNALYTVDNHGQKKLRAPNSNKLKFMLRLQNEKKG